MRAGVGRDVASVRSADASKPSERCFFEKNGQDLRMADADLEHAFLHVQELVGTTCADANFASCDPYKGTVTFCNMKI